MYALMADYGNGSMELHDNLSFDEVMVLEARYDALGVDTSTFDADTPLEMHEEVNMTEEEIKRQLEVEWTQGFGSMLNLFDSHY